MIDSAPVATPIVFLLSDVDVGENYQERILKPIGQLWEVCCILPVGPDLIYHLQFQNFLVLCQHPVIPTGLPPNIC